MKVLELLEELEDIVENSSGLPLTGKIMVDGTEIFDIIKEIRVALPDEIEQAQWVKEERQRLIEEGHEQSEKLVREAKVRIEGMIENDELSMKARMKAEQILKTAETNASAMKKNSLEYVDGILGDFQEKMIKLNKTYVDNMFATLQHGFDNIHETVDANRTEVRKMLYPNGDPDKPEQVEELAEEEVTESSQLEIMDIEEV